MVYSFRLAVRVLLYAPSLRQDSTYHSLCYTCRGALAGMRNSSMGAPWRIDPTTHRTMSECSYHRATHRTLSVWLQMVVMRNPIYFENRFSCSLGLIEWSVLHKAPTAESFLCPPTRSFITTKLVFDIFISDWIWNDKQSNHQTCTHKR